MAEAGLLAFLETQPDSHFRDVGPRRCGHRVHGGTGPPGVLPICRSMTPKRPERRCTRSPIPLVVGGGNGRPRGDTAAPGVPSALYGSGSKPLSEVTRSH